VAIGTARPAGGQTDPVQAEIVAGLSAAAPAISPKYFYDALGSRLFEAITALPEYYPTRTEGALLARCLGDIARAVGPGCTLIDLGAGNCEKAARLFGPLAPSQFAGVDISAEFLQGAIARLRRDHPGIEMLAVGSDISAQIALPPDVGRNHRLFSYLGSSIGNFVPDDAVALLQRVREHCRQGGALLIGVDLVKSVDVLHAAYNDNLGVTAAFNLNVLNHVNRLIGSNFNVGDWQHLAFFNSAQSRIEMHLEARRDVSVRWPGGGRSFSGGERIHTENSYKYTRQGFGALLERAGFDRIESWADEREWFAVFLARATP
jgi:dimethylhistidine N-methyltransferase